MLNLELTGIVDEYAIREKIFKVSGLSETWWCLLRWGKTGREAAFGEGAEGRKQKFNFRDYVLEDY